VGVWRWGCSSSEFWIFWDSNINSFSLYSISLSLDNRHCWRLRDPETAWLLKKVAGFLSRYFLKLVWVIVLIKASLIESRPKSWDERGFFGSEPWTRQTFFGSERWGQTFWERTWFWKILSYSDRIQEYFRNFGFPDSSNLRRGGDINSKLNPLE
jgi:hypothetical protein